MNKLEFLVDSDENIWEVERITINTGKSIEEGISLAIGDETEQFEIVFSESDLEKMLSVVRG